MCVWGVLWPLLCDLSHIWDNDKKNNDKAKQGSEKEH